jgi:hypothetical protein
MKAHRRKSEAPIVQGFLRRPDNFRIDLRDRDNYWHKKFRSSCPLASFKIGACGLAIRLSDLYSPLLLDFG